MSIYLDKLNEENVEPVIEASDFTEDLNAYLDTYCASADVYDEGAIQDLKDKITDVKQLWEQWKKSTNSFVNHKWIYRYITPQQKEQIMKHYNAVCDEKTPYSTYKRSFQAICKFVGIPHNTVILENVVFKKDSKDRDQEVIAVKYSKGLVKVKIPDNICLIHNTPVDTNELKPSYRSKVKGKYMYPTKRCFFSLLKVVKPTKAGLEGQKTHNYTPKQKITTAYIDPTYPDFRDNCVYVETESPIPVENYNTFRERLFKNLKAPINKVLGGNDEDDE